MRPGLPEIPADPATTRSPDMSLAASPGYEFSASMPARKSCDVVGKAGNARSCCHDPVAGGRHVIDQGSHFRMRIVSRFSEPPVRIRDTHRPPNHQYPLPTTHIARINGSAEPSSSWYLELSLPRDSVCARVRVEGEEAGNEMFGEFPSRIGTVWKLSQFLSGFRVHPSAWSRSRCS